MSKETSSLSKTSHKTGIESSRIEESGDALLLELPDMFEEEGY